MKKTLLFLGALALSLGANAQTERELMTNNDMNMSGFIVACNYGVDYDNIASENTYHKNFDLAALGVQDSFHVQSIDFGVLTFDKYDQFPQSLDKIPVLFELWKSNSNSFPAGWGGNDYTFIEDVVYNVKENDSGNIVTAHLADPATFAATDNIIVSISHDDLMQLDGEQIIGANRFFLGLTEGGDSNDTYITSDGCSLNLDSFASIGAGDLSLILKLRGVEGTLSVEDVVFEGFKHFTSNNTLHISNDTAIQTVEIYNVLGQKVIANNVNSTNVSVDLANLTNGVYITKVTVDGIEKTFKIIK